MSVLPAALSAVLLVASFPDLNINSLAWVAIIPLFFAIEGQKPSRAFLLAYCTGVLFFLGTLYWLIHVTLPGMIAVVLYLALYFGLFGLSLSGMHSNKLRLIVAPAAWVVLEWIRSHFLMGFGWVLLAHSQTGNLTIIQVADILGAYGVSFLIVLVNIAIYLTLKDLLDRKHTTLYLMIALSAVFLATAYGVIRLKNIFPGERLKVAVIQGNIPQDQKWDERFRKDILNKYERLTREAAGQSPDLVVWPETSVPAFIEFEKDVADRISALAKNVRAPILVGAPSVASAASAASPDVLYNSAILFDDDGKVIGHYNKLHLVPFGEYVPFKRALSFVERFAPSPIGDFSAGKEMTVFNFFIQRRSVDRALTTKLTKKVKFSCLICFEDIFPELGRKAVKNGANFLVNITNDAWFKRSSAPHQHAQSSVFRAVENRVNVVRAANTGLSCFIDQKGAIAAPVEAGGKDIFVDGFSVHEIVLARTRTFYTVYGDLFVYSCMGALIGIMLLKGFRKI
jgi:apolipoprotein N-acyltransferase